MKILYVTTISATMGFFSEHIKMLFSRSPFSPNNLKTYKMLKKLVKTEHYDIVHTHTPSASMIVRLACRNVRNAVTWETKIGYNLKYIKNITFLENVKIILTTLGKVFRRDGITEEKCDTATDLADCLLAEGRFTHEQQAEAKRLIAEAM